ncbi:MAG TPA: hypothetical protein VNZ52_02595, partial [Candidatus Thermoplasmatota archaeon]|nr:hypothetical protein [Candidatus Thermoplasmatota archaeon]
MPTLSRASRARVLVGLLLLVAAPLASPLAQAHEGHDHGGATGPVTDENQEPGAPAPGSKFRATQRNLSETPWLTGYHDSILWGNVTRLPLPEGMNPTALRASPSWLAWFAAGPVPGATNVYLYDPANGEGYWVSNDTKTKDALALGEDAVVWSTIEGGRSYLYAHRISQGITSIIANDTHRFGEVAVGAAHVAYVRYTLSENHVVLVDFVTGARKVVTDSPGRRESLAFAGDMLAWRDTSYNLVDVGFHRVSTGETGYLTRDVYDERRILTDGRAIFFLLADSATGPAVVWNPDTERLIRTNLNVRIGLHMLASEGLLYFATAGGSSGTISVGNPRTGHFTQVAWSLNMTSLPVAAKKTLYYVHTEGDVAELVAFRPSPIAERRTPAVVLPGASTGIYRYSPYQIQGFLEIPDGWGNLREIRYRTSATGNWTTVPGGRNFTIDVNPRDYPPGSVRFQVQAVFWDAPSVDTYTAQFFMARPRAPLDFDIIR